MKCPKCGTDYEDSFKFCPKCAEPKPAITPTPEKKFCFPKGMNLAVSIVALVLIIALLATTIIFGLAWTSAKKEANKTRAEAESAMKALATLDEIEETAKSLSVNTMKSAVILMKEGSPTSAYWDLTKEMASQVGELTGKVMKANGKTQEEIQEFLNSIVSEM